MKTLMNLPLSIDDLDLIIDLMDDGNTHNPQHAHLLRNLINASVDFKAKNK